MNEPLETLHLQEGILYPIAWKKRNFWGKIKPIVVGIVLCIVILSLVLRTNMFMELSTFSRVAIILLFIRVLFTDVDEWVPSDVDWIFYEDRMEIFRNKVYRGKRLWRQEWNCMYYKDMKRIKYRVQTEKIVIEGVNYCKYKEYDNKTGELKDHYSRDKAVDAAFMFYSRYMDLDLVLNALEKYTPLKVEERMS